MLLFTIHIVKMCVHSLIPFKKFFEKECFENYLKSFLIADAIEFILWYKLMCSMDINNTKKNP